MPLPFFSPSQIKFIGYNHRVAIYLPEVNYGSTLFSIDHWLKSMLRYNSSR